MAIFLQYVLPAIISGIVSYIVANKQSQEKTKQVMEETKVKLKEIETNSKTELEKIERESQNELLKMREEYEIQKDTQLNKEVMSLLKDNPVQSLDNLDKTMTKLSEISEKWGDKEENTK